MSMIMVWFGGQFHDLPNAPPPNARTITIEADGVFYIVPTIVNGRRYGYNDALRMWEEGQNPELGRYKTEEEALDVARRLSGRREAA